MKKLQKSSFILAALLATGLAYGCNDDSSNSGNPADQGEQTTPENTPELCQDEIDNDSNGNTDCEDDSCKSLEICNSLTPSDTTDTTDNNELCLYIEQCGDDEENKCEVYKPCEQRPNVNDNNDENDELSQKVENTDELCKDKQDNDEDNKTDCDDPDCRILDVCKGWEKAENTIETCKDGVDNDGDYLTDCDDEDCQNIDFCKEENDLDWKAEGGECKASEFMTPDSTDPIVMANNFVALRELIEKDDKECTNIELDGHYYLQPADKKNSTNSSYTKKYISLNRIVRIFGQKTANENDPKTGILDFGEFKTGFRFYPGNGEAAKGGGLIMEDIKLVAHSDEPTKGQSVFDGYEYPNQYHGTAGRLMFRRCEFDVDKILIKIEGVDRHYKAGAKGQYNYGTGTPITEDEIEEYSTRINRITVKDSKGHISIHLWNFGILDKLEIVNNKIDLPCAKGMCMAVSWATLNDVDLADKLNTQGNAHVIFSHNKVKGPGKLMRKTSYYSAALLAETKIVNYEDNEISDIYVVSDPQTFDDNGVPTKIDSAVVYDAYLSSNHVVARNNHIKNVMGFGVLYEPKKKLQSYFNELMKGKGAWTKGTKLYQNNTWTYDENKIDEYLNIIINGGELGDGTTLKPMVISDGQGGSRSLNDEEKEAFRHTNKTFWTMMGHNFVGLNEISLIDNTINLPGLYLEGTYYLNTRKFTAIGNKITAKSINRQSRGTTNMFDVYPYKYNPNYKAFTTQNESLHTDIEIKDNILSLSDQQHEDSFKYYKLSDGKTTIPNYGFPLLQITKSSKAAYLDAEGNSQIVEFDIGKVVFEGNKDKDGNKLYWCKQTGSNWWKTTCYADGEYEK